MSGACKTLGIGFTETPLLNGLFILPVTVAISYAAFIFYDRPLRRWPPSVTRYSDRHRDAWTFSLKSGRRPYCPVCRRPPCPPASLEERHPPCTENPYRNI